MPTATPKMPEMPSVTASQISAPPTWALLQRKLMSLMEQAAPVMSLKYADRGGTWYWSDDMDDYYERSGNWCLLYALGGGEHLVDLALKHWNATNRLFDDRDGNRANHLEYTHGVAKTLKHSIHNEYFSLAHPGDAEWHHMGEGNMAFYDFGVADPTISENARRARRFAGFYIGEDDEAKNYDPVHKVIRSPINSSQGPYLKATLNEAMDYLHGGTSLNNPAWKPRKPGTRSSLYPIVKDLEFGWWDDPEKSEKIIGLFNDIILNGDIAANLSATGLVTNAYLYTGDERYKQWVLDYVGVWAERTRQNNGIIPDNVGPTGKIGEQRQGVWYGGLYGWNSSYGYNRLFHSLNLATECAVLLSGDLSYTEMMRTTIRALIDNSEIREDGHMLTPVRITPEGWYRGGDPDPVMLPPQSLRVYEPAHLYHMTMSQEDRATIIELREGDKERDWNEVTFHPDERADWQTEYSRFQYYEGLNPDWPVKALTAQYQQALERHERLMADDRDVPAIIAANEEPPNPVITKVLTQTMLGSPHSVYHGGLLRGTVRYFDKDLVRPGLPADVGALVDMLAADAVGVQLVNLSRNQSRCLIVQAGAFGEHEFTTLQHGEMTMTVNSKYFEVRLPPSSSIRIQAGLRRFVNDPSYAFPWHGSSVPVPFK
jgi:hypothetical protein